MARVTLSQIVDGLAAALHLGKRSRKRAVVGRPAAVERVLPPRKSAKGSKPPTLVDSLERLVKFAAVGTALLPLVGLVVRILRFWGVPGGVDWMPRALGLDIAAAQDLTHLSLSGFDADSVMLQWAVVWGLVGAVAWAISMAPAQTIKAEFESHSNAVKRLGLVLKILAAAAAFAYYALSWPFVGAASMAVITFVGWWLIELELTRTTPPSWNNVIGAAVVIGLAAALADGSTYWQPQPEKVTFTSDSTSPKPIDDGWYGELGRNSDQVYLTPCDGSSRVLVVAPSEIKVTNYAPDPPRTGSTGFWRTLSLTPVHWEWTVGFQGCKYP